MSYKTKHYGDRHITQTLKSFGRYKLRKPKPNLKDIEDCIKIYYGDDFMIVSISEIE